MHKSPRPIMKRKIALLCQTTLLTVALFSSALSPGEEKTTTTADYLEVNLKPDGKCLGLQRGNAVTLANRHSTVIHYRLARYLEKRRQPGLTVGSIMPTPENDAGEKLGCELLNGLRQEWRVVRALLAE